jgi:hypothetical protein
MIDVAYSLAAMAIIAVGAICSRLCLREQRRERLSELRRRQLGREADESEPITWRR